MDLYSGALEGHCYIGNKTARAVQLADLVAGSWFIVEHVVCLAAKTECRARFGSVSITACSCKHSYSHARRRQGIFEHGLGKLRPKPTEMASQISPALGIFKPCGTLSLKEKQSKVQMWFCINLKGLFLGLPGRLKFRSIFSVICVIIKTE